MFFIGQNLKHVHMIYSVIELLIFFWLTLDISCLKFQKQSSSEVYFSSHQRNIVSKQTFSLVSYIDVEKTGFLM